MRDLKMNMDDLEEMVTKRGVKVYFTPPEILRAQLEAWDRVLERESKANPFFAKADPGPGTDPTERVSGALPVSRRKGAIFSRGDHHAHEGRLTVGRPEAFTHHFAAALQGLGAGYPPWA
jgi:hypothetical protein